MEVFESPQEQRRLVNEQHMIAEMLNKMRAKRLARAHARAGQMYMVEMAKLYSDDEPQQFSNDDDQPRRQPAHFQSNKVDDDDDDDDDNFTTNKGRNGSSRGYLRSHQQHLISRNSETHRREQH